MFCCMCTCFSLSLWQNHQGALRLFTNACISCFQHICLYRQSSGQHGKQLEKVRHKTKNNFLFLTCLSPNKRIAYISSCIYYISLKGQQKKITDLFYLHKLEWREACPYSVPYIFLNKPKRWYSDNKSHIFKIWTPGPLTK